jgi:FK506-binding nuclear protein
MQVGGERVLLIPPELAYGKKASKDIPANSTLRFGKSISHSGSNRA